MACDRRNATPPGTVALRARIDADALVEEGWAHLLEHVRCAVRATRVDGEAVKLWQQLGASFGSDINATTAFRSTACKLDPPRSDAKSLVEAVGALAGMMQNVTIGAELLEIERVVVRLHPIL